MSEGIKINVILCFSVLQVLFVVCVGVIYVLFFVGWVDDIGWDGLEFICQIKEVFVFGDIQIKVFVVSIWYLQYVVQVVFVGVDVVIIFYKVFIQMVKYLLIQVGFDSFMVDWVKCQGVSLEMFFSEVGINLVKKEG